MEDDIDAGTGRIYLSPTRLCPKCKLQQPTRHFRVWDEVQLHCRACRQRTNAKKIIRERRARDKLIGKLKRVEKLAKTKKGIQIACKELRALKTRFGEFTAFNKLRLKKLRAVANPTSRTLEAIQRRADMQARCQAVYEAQVRELQAGGQPMDIAGQVDSTCP